MKHVCVLASGGIDSAALLHHFLRLGRTVHPVYICSGYRWEKAELVWLRRLLKSMSHPRLKPLTIMTIPIIEIHGGRSGWALTGKGVPGARSADEAVYLPGRNVLLLSKASVLSAQRGFGSIGIGTLKGNPFPDASATFFRELSRAVSIGLGRPVRIETPFLKLSKQQVMRRERGVPWQLTFSCLAPRGPKMCGRCNKCEERRKALNGVKA